MVSDAPAQQQKHPTDGPQPQFLSDQAAWCPQGCDFVIDNRLVAGGLSYVGVHLEGASTIAQEPGMVNPLLPVDWENIVLEPDDTIGESAAYDQMYPAARAGYLAWLASGRCRPDVPLGFLHVYFSGLERRLLHDLKSDVAHEEFGVIRDEIKRLAECYPETSEYLTKKFRSLLHIIDVLECIHHKSNIRLSAIDEAGTDATMLLQVACGIKIDMKETIDPAWALRVARCSHEVSMPSMADQYSEVFTAKFIDEYLAREGRHASPPRPVDKVRILYSPVSKGFRGFHVWKTDLPDIMSAKSWLYHLNYLLQSTTQNLRKFSTAAGRRGADDLQALAELPHRMLCNLSSPTLDTFREWRKALQEPARVMSAEEFAQAVNGGERLTRTRIRAAAQAMSAFDLGIMADRSVGWSTALKPDRQIAIYDCPPTHAHVLFSDNLEAYACAVFIAAAVCDDASDVLAALEAHIRARQDEASYSAKHQDMLVTALMPLWELAVAANAPKKSLGSVCARVTGNLRQMLRESMLTGLGRQGKIRTSQMDRLSAIYSQWELPEAALYTDLHNAAAPASPSASSGNALRLDVEKIAATMDDTALAADLLSQIFTEEDHEDRTPSVNKDSDEDSHLLIGLESNLMDATQLLILQPEWPREAAAALMAQHGFVLAEAAFDTVNDAFVDLCGEPLIEGFDPLEINEYAWQSALQNA